MITYLKRVKIVVRALSLRIWAKKRHGEKERRKGKEREGGWTDKKVKK